MDALQLEGNLSAWWSSPKCDPRASGLVKADDQMLPAYVMQIAGKFYSIPGLKGQVAYLVWHAESKLSVTFCVGTTCDCGGDSGRRNGFPYPRYNIQAGS
ncbi:hypothetical protein HCN44_010221 [Aphidius gifuensis]|uniref:Uncharacterized protein n=1 Tax=Aphidius gifuensis TaxID=684658 RepID=A0A834XVK8_APHGI|nr:hypothetical protein HCN44_010221 [Aphidius gifuensis]